MRFSIAAAIQRNDLNDGDATAVSKFFEPLFQWMGANVDAIPVMNFDDLKKDYQIVFRNNLLLFNQFIQ
jgi:hypothetical protein